MKEKRIPTDTFTLPESWASYLINEDSSGLEPEEKAQADQAIEYIGLGEAVDCSELYYGNPDLPAKLFPDVLWGEVADYTFYVQA